MWRAVLRALLLGSVAAAAPAAQEARRYHVMLGAAYGPTFPMGDLGDVANVGWHLGGRIGLLRALASGNVGVAVDGQYHSLTGDAFRIGTARFTRHTRVTVGALNAVWAFARLDAPPEAGVLRPFVMAGPGLYGVRYRERCGSSCTLSSTTDTRSRTGVTAALGTVLAFRAVSFDLELRLHHIPDAIRPQGDWEAARLLTFDAGFRLR